MKAFAADLHIHTALSPCAMDEMTPPAIVHQAVDRGLDLIAICDHNSAGNVAAAQQAAAKHLAVLAGIEITTAEEAHVVGLFRNAADAEETGAEVREGLPARRKAGRVSDSQWVMDHRGEVVGNEFKMLSVASTFTVSGAADLIRRHGGLVIAAHVDRPSFSVTSQLGALPEDVRFDALEISSAGVRAQRHAAFASLGIPLVTSSDSHFLSEIGASWTVLEMQKTTFDELALALEGAGGRRCCLA